MNWLFRVIKNKKKRRIEKEDANRLWEDVKLGHKITWDIIDAMTSLDKFKIFRWTATLLWGNKVKLYKKARNGRIVQILGKEE